jgi:hypothetical protein
MGKRFPFTINLAKGDYERLVQLAARKKQTVARLAASLIEESLKANDGVVHAELGHDGAEEELYAWVARYAEAAREADAWDENVTLRVFQAIEQHAVRLYEAAISKSHPTRINRGIGALVRKSLGANTRKKNGASILGYPKAGESTLIRSFTLLFREPDAGQSQCTPR